jgi:hypothetical protein
MIVRSVAGLLSWSSMPMGTPRLGVEGMALARDSGAFGRVASAECGGNSG